MSDIVKRLRMKDEYLPLGHDGWEAADRIEELEAKLSKAMEAFVVIDALDPEGLIDGCSHSALRGLVLRMGEVARTTIAELKGGKDE